ncbi:MAG: amino acid ABC transporter permease [Spirochaetaceae bacterium]|jgi:His/Glu/Gln/Arg/opine family amino acid ABC transporter permease subunit|nr:amino acid ABC transporter permease [Spirochaetaceae bacterium]
MDFITVLKDVFPLLAQGALVTLETTVLALVLALFLGLFTCLACLGRKGPLLYLARGYITLIRGTPLLVQTFFVYFGVPQLIQSLGINFRLSPFAAGIITLSLNAGAYIAEIFRGGILAIDPGQMEAARSLGFSYHRAMYRVILPQALRVSIPSLVNQFIISLKDTSIISIISLADICYQAKIYIGRTMQSFTTWTIVGMVYLVIILALSHLSNHIEKRLSISDRSSSAPPQKSTALKST